MRPPFTSTTSGPARAGRRRGRTLGVLVLLVALLAPTSTASAQFGPTGPSGPTGPGGPSSPGFGTGGVSAFTPGTSDPYGMVSPTGAASLFGSSTSLSQIDPITGGMGTDASMAANFDLAATHDLMDAGMMAVDLAAIAERSRIEAEAKRREAEERERRGGGTGVAVRRSPNPGAPAPHELKNFSTCGVAGNARYEARILTVNLFEEMCQAALRDGVRLQINSAYRSPARQGQLWQEALRKYGSVEAARKWVAPSDGRTCNSQHCSGIAIDVSQANGAHTWMHRPKGCATGDNVTLGSTSCGGGSVVKQAQLYGFVIPMSWEPWHIEVGVTVDAGDGSPGSGPVDASCNPPRSYTVPQMIGAIWRCRLDQAGITGSTQRQIVAEAVVVAKCESGWNSSAVVFNGRYLNTPHPRTGMRYSAAGVFQFIRGSANTWVPGGYANVKDPVANIDGAARYFISNYKRGGRRVGWAPWACAAVNDGFAKKSVLPGFPGGPSSLPSYAYQY